MQNLGVTNKEHYGMLWYFLEWSTGSCLCSIYKLFQVTRVQLVNEITLTALLSSDRTKESAVSFFFSGLLPRLSRLACLAFVNLQR